MNLKNKWNIFIYFACAFIVIIMILSVILLKGNDNSIGSNIVMDLYNFKDVQELSDNDDDLKEKTTESAYEILSVTKQDKALNYYLKLKNLPTSVEIIRQDESSKGGYVLYTLHSNALSEGRKFLLIYDIVKGKLDNPREMECIDFIGDKNKYTDSEIYDDSNYN